MSVAIRLLELQLTLGMLRVCWELMSDSILHRERSFEEALQLLQIDTVSFRYFRYLLVSKVNDKVLATTGGSYVEPKELAISQPEWTFAQHIEFVISSYCSPVDGENIRSGTKPIGHRRASGSSVTGSSAR